MAHPRCTFLVVDEDGTGRVHRARSRTGPLDHLVRHTLGGRPEQLPLAIPGLAVWSVQDRGPSGRGPNQAGSRLIARLGGPAIAVAGPIAVTGTGTGLSAAAVTALRSALSAAATRRHPAQLRPAGHRTSTTPTVEG